MLNYTIKNVENENTFEEIILSEVYFDAKCNYITGITSEKSNLVDGQDIYLEFNNSGEMNKNTVYLKKSLRQGYIIDPDKEYVIEDYEYNGQVFKAVRYDDGMLYEVSQGEDGSKYQGIDVINIDGTFYDVKNKEDSFTSQIYKYIKVPKKYYIENDKVNISGVTYDIQTDLGNQDITVYNGLYEGGKELKATIYDAKNWETVNKVEIKKKNDYALPLDDLGCAQKFFYVETADEDGSENYFFTVEPNGLDMSLTYKGVEYKATINDSLIIIDDNTYSIKSEWLNCSYGDVCLNLFLKRTDLDISVGDKIIVEKTNGKAELCQVFSESYFIYNGNKCIFEIIDENTMYFNLCLGDGTYSEITCPNTSTTVTIKEDEYQIVKKYFIYFNGKKYKVSDENDTKDFVNISYLKAPNLLKFQSKSYEITKITYDPTNETYYGYYKVNDTIIPIYVNGGEVSKYSYEDSYFTASDNTVLTVEKKRYATINGVHYLVSERGRDNVDDDNVDKDSSDLVVEVNLPEKYEFIVEEVKSNNNVRCRITSDDESKNIVYSIYSNKEKYSFFLKNELFNEKNINSPNIGYVDNYGYSIDTIRYYIKTKYFTLPILFNNSVGNNMLQETIVKRDFVEEEINKRINRIVDMEKDMYYPAFSGDDETKLIDELTFKLHFRTRDLKTWKVIEDNVTSYLDGGGKIENLNASALTCNWNIIDYYYDDAKNIGVEISPTLSGQNITYEWVDYEELNRQNATYDNTYDADLDVSDMRVKKVVHGAIQTGRTYDGQIIYENGGNGAFDAFELDSHNETHSLDPYDMCADNAYYSSAITKYDQPSDLFYFLNFTDNDVYYQKNKVKKSFLRLLFYDSNDPKIQSLLATSTIFFDVDRLFKHYLENADPDVHDDYGFIKMSNGEYSEYCGVDREPFYLGEDGIWTYNEEFRIDATFNVKNMFSELKSSEGFYLFLFKEYSSNLHERTIYLKIQFNHAGTGKVVNLLVPTDSGHTNDYGDVEYDLLDITNKEQREWFKKGYPLKELYDRQYLKIKVKYDEKNRKYIYYLPKFMMNPANPNKAIFNLYETKIKDESAINYD